MSKLMKPSILIPTLVALGLMLASRLYTPVPLPHIQVQMRLSGQGKTFLFLQGPPS